MPRNVQKIKDNASKIIDEMGLDAHDIRAVYIRLIVRANNPSDEEARREAMGDLKCFHDQHCFGFLLGFRACSEDYSEPLRDLIHKVSGCDFETQRKRHVQTHAESLTPEQRRNARHRWNDFRRDHIAEIKFQLSELADADPEFLCDVIDRVYGKNVAEAISFATSGEVAHG